jgi:hypothetical protein
MDIDHIRNSIGNSYDDAIKQALDHARDKGL